MRFMKKINKGYIPLSIPDITTKELHNAVACLKSGWLSTGKFNFELEERIRKYTGSKEAICVDSCTAGLYLSLLVSGITAGDEVITTPFTFAATANVIVHCGAKPVFCDIDPDTYNIDSRKIVKKLTKRTKAIIPVHFAGHPCDLERIYDIAERHGLTVIEDAAHALGSAIKGRRIGSYNGITCFSFYATKNITTGEGGCITLNDSDIARRIRVLRYHGIDRDAWKRYGKGGNWRYEIIEAGYKNNLSDLQASIGVAQIKRITQLQARREEIARIYNMGLCGYPGIVLPKAGSGITHSWHLYAVRIKNKEFGMGRDEFIAAMDKEDIGTSVHYIPLHLHAFYRKKYGYKKDDFPIAEAISAEIVSLPMFTRISNANLKRVIKTIRSIR